MCILSILFVIPDKIIIEFSNIFAFSVYFCIMLDASNPEPKIKAGHLCSASLHPFQCGPAIHRWLSSCTWCFRHFFRLNPVLRTSVWVPWSIAERFPLFPSSSTLPRRSASPRFHDGLPHCRREPCRASTILMLSSPPGTFPSCTSARCTTSRAASTSSLPRACSRPSDRLVFPCIPHSYKCAFSGRIYPLVVQYFWPGPAISAWWAPLSLLWFYFTVLFDSLAKY